MNTQSLVPQVFNFQQVPLRGLLIEQQPWMVAKDLCGLLGIQNSRDTLKKVLDKDEIAVATIMATDQVAGVDNRYTRTQRRKVQVVSESGMYALVFKSRKPEAKAVRKWITGEVLPAIRKGGSYAAPEAHNPLDFLNGIFGTAGQAAPKAAPKLPLLPPVKKKHWDASHLPYDIVALRGGQVRTVCLAGRHWYIVKDVLNAIGTHSVRPKEALAQMPTDHRRLIRFFGIGTPAWCVSDIGLRMMLVSRGLLTSQLTLNLAH